MYSFKKKISKKFKKNFFQKKFPPFSPIMLLRLLCPLVVLLLDQLKSVPHNVTPIIVSPL